VVISAFIMVVLFGLIMTEVLHRTMAAMLGAAMCMIMLAIQNRVPSLSKVLLP
jgi:Na+/H+ antiporter NhaD/arsenite permease-like protein